MDRTIKNAIRDMEAMRQELRTLNNGWVHLFPEVYYDIHHYYDGATMIKAVIGEYDYSHEEITYKADIIQGPEGLILIGRSLSVGEDMLIHWSSSASRSISKADKKKLANRLNPLAR